MSQPPWSEAAKVAANFIWRIEGISISNREELKPFRNVDPLRVSAMATAGPVRTFQVEWVGSQAAHEVEDIVSRVAYHTFEVSIAYPQEWLLGKRTRVTLDDRSDLVKALRSQNSWTGYSDATSSDDIGLESRELMEDRLEDVEQATFMRQRWRCLIREAE